ncbi:DUF2927 domain-containing protein [Chthonobacter rhizosphaerae]|uniref:DUF2927 domain-containing protein n=1 Tax=Chthonobacter rhizosphaerae TaxID=2735553 RepID=UPI0015EEA614|nr:DUF2927 domain-containing protein [Chthonobacter rhizosphaerae]
MLLLLATSLLAAMTAVPSAASASPLKPFSDRDLATGFLATVFGLEHGAAGAGMVKKFNGPVRFEIAIHSAIDREADVARFVRQLPRMVRGLDARLARSGEDANFKIVVVDRDSYVKRARLDAFSSAFARVPGNCMVKVDFSPSGIRRATAVIVSDNGEALFRRCMVEEILQGLGPMNDDPRLGSSVFNDRSPHARFMPFDRAIISMLYDGRVRHGASRTEVLALLPDLIRSARAAVR